MSWGDKANKCQKYGILSVYECECGKTNEEYSLDQINMTKLTWPNEYDPNLLNMTKFFTTTMNLNVWIWPKLIILV